MDKISYEELMIGLCLSMLIYNYNENEFFIIKPGHTLRDFYKNIDFHFDIYQREALLYLFNNCPDGKIIKFIDNSKTGVQCAIIDNIKELYIVFRGTDSYTDCIYDSICCKTYIEINETSIIGIHTGFYSQFEHTYKEIIDIILEFISKDYNIYITGHSLAHSLSVLLSYFISDFTTKNIKIITFGGPKIGNYEWKTEYETKKNLLLYRFINCSDIVTIIPNINYYHVGVPIYISKEGISCDNDNDDNSFNYYNVNDHSIINYYNNFYRKEELYNNLIKNIK